MRAGEQSAKGACGESEAQKPERSMAAARSRRCWVPGQRLGEFREASASMGRKSEKVLDGRGMDSRQRPREGGKGGWKPARGLHLWTHEAAPHHSQPCPCPCPCPRPLGAIRVQGIPGEGCGRKRAEANFLIQVEDVLAVPGKTLPAAVHFNLETGPDQQPSGPASRIRVFQRKRNLRFAFKLALFSSADTGHRENRLALSWGE